MEKSFITVNNVYLHLKPVHFEPYMAIFGLFLLVSLVYIYRNHRDKASTTLYVLISCLIFINGLIIPWFMKNIFLEQQRFSGYTMEQTTEKLMTPLEFTFYKEVNKRLKPGDKFLFAEPWDSYYLNVKTKHKLSFYLAPKLLAKSADEANYVIVVNHKSNKDFSTPFPNSRLTPEYFIYDKLILLKVLKEKEND